MANHWTGYWEQRSLGRQPMLDLMLQIGNGNVCGRGRDVVGPFTFSGRIETGGQVVLTKQYIGQHSVLYQGQYDGEGTIFGQWSIGPWYRGDFVLQLSRSNQDAAGGDAIEEIRTGR